MLLPCYFLSSCASSSSEHLQASQREIASSSSSLFCFHIFSPVTAASNIQHKTNFSINNTYLSSFRSMIPQFLSSKLPGNDSTIAFFKLPGTDSTSHFSNEIKIFKVSRVLKMISTRARNGSLPLPSVFAKESLLRNKAHSEGTGDIKQLTSSPPSELSSHSFPFLGIDFLANPHSDTHKVQEISFPENTLTYCCCFFFLPDPRKAEISATFSCSSSSSSCSSSS
jgi:hypothetical protein